MNLQITGLKVDAGEGSRGGHVIGHTSSGKPVYSTGNKGTKGEGFSTQDHRDAHKIHNREIDKILHKKQGPTVDKETSSAMDRHRKHAQHHLKTANNPPRRKFQEE